MQGRPAFRVVLGLLMLITASLACNARFGDPDPTASTQGPSVVFISPENNASIAEGTALTFAVNVTNPGGVSKVDFLVNDVPLGSQAAPSPAQTAFTARQPWTAAGIQGHLVVAVASDASGKTIGDAKLTLQVVAKPQTDAVAGAPTPAAPTTAAPAPTAQQPAAPPTDATAAQPLAGVTIVVATNPPPAETASGPKMTVTNPNLNVRAGDGTNFPVIAGMKTGDTAIIVGRNAARTWWVIQRDQLRGWVINDKAAGQNLYNVEGDTANVPLAKSPNTPVPTAGSGGGAQAPTSTATTGFADLIFVDAKLEPVTPVVNQTFKVVITVKNQGTVDAPASTIIGVFQPGNETSPAEVGALKAGEQVTVNMAVTLKQAGANQTGVLALDNYNKVTEGPSGKDNNKRTVTYNVNQ